MAVAPVRVVPEEQAPPVVLETPDAADSTVLVIKVPGARPGERAQAVQRTANGVSSQSCGLRDETCTLHPPVGRWLVSVVQLAARPTEVPFDVMPGHNELTLERVKTNTVLVRVVDSAGAPVPGASLVKPEEGPQAERFSAGQTDLLLTDARGEGALELAVGQQQTILARAEGYLDSDRLTVRASDGLVTMTLTSAASFRGRVVTRDGRVVTSFSIDGRPFEASDGRFSQRTILRVRNSQQHVTFRAPGLVPTVRVVEASSGDVDLGDVVLEGARTIRGRVLDRQTGQPLAGRVVGALNRRAACDELGQFSLEEQPAGAVQLTALARAHAAESIEVGPDQNDVVIRLGGGLTVAGVYKGPAMSGRWVIAVGPTVERVEIGADQHFVFDSLRPGRWSFTVTPHPAEHFVVEGLPLERQDSFLHSIMQTHGQPRQLELGTSPVTNLELE